MAFEVKKKIFYLIFFSIGLFCVNTLYAQSTSYTFTIKNKALKKAIEMVEKGSGYHFLYSDGTVDLKQKVTVSVIDGSITEVVDQLLKNSMCEYRIKGKQVLLFKNSTKSSKENSEEKTLGSIDSLEVYHISGRVTDVEGEALIGASVQVKGTSQGAITNIDGEYSIEVANNESVLSFNYIGYEPHEEAVGSRNTVNVILQTKASLLDEVVVVAYGVQRKSSVTGSMNALKAKDLGNITSPNVESMLQGKVPGMSVTNSSGRPGESAVIRIRGKGSMGTGQGPLWVVDGVVGGMTSELNPNDIESISVLKDGSSTALYGSRAANGVILVTTKSGKVNSSNLSISTKLGVTKLSRGNFKVMNSRELYNFAEQAGAGSSFTWLSPELQNYDTNWWDIVTQSAFSQNYNISYTSGTEKLKLYLSGDYYGEEGTVKGYDYNRFTVRSNVDYRVNDRLTLKTKVAGTYWYDDNRQSSIAAASLYLPWDTPYNSRGDIKTGKEGTANSLIEDNWYGRDGNNFMYDQQLNWAQGKQFGVDGTFGFDYKIIDGLVFESTNSIGIKYKQTETYTDPASQGGMGDNGKMGSATNFFRNRYTNQLLRYSNIFNQVHDVSAFLGYEYSDFYTYETSGAGKGNPSGGEIVGVTAVPTSAWSNKWLWNMVAFYFNANYIYDERYSAQVSFRRDGSTKFGVNSRYGNFYTVGLAWNVHKESFLKSYKFLDELKLRLSYGSTGNTPDASYSHLNLYQMSLGYNGQSSLFPFQKGNPLLTWEKCYSTNVGLDVRLFDRLQITGDFYIKDTSDLLYNAKLSALSGYTSQWMNVGKVKNTGFEVSFIPEIIKTKDWYWNINFNIGVNKNEVKDLYNNKNQINGNKIYNIGDDMDSWYLREWAGVDVQTGAPLWFKVDENGERSLVKDVKEATRVILGTSSPKVYGGFSTDLSFRDFSLSASFVYASGHYIYNSARENFDSDGVYMTYNSMRLKSGWSRWSKPGDRATHPKPMVGGNNSSNATSSRYLEDGSYFKMKSLTLSYKLPSEFIKRARVKSASISLSAENIFTITNFSGIDPEVSTGDSNKGSFETGAYPSPRRISLGINLNF